MVEYSIETLKIAVLSIVMSIHQFSGKLNIPLFEDIRDEYDGSPIFSAERSWFLFEVDSFMKTLSASKKVLV